MILKKSKILKISASLLVFIFLFTTTFCIKPLTTHASVLSDADTAMQAYNTKFWDSNTHYFWADSSKSSYQSFWVEAELWEMVMDAYQNTKDPQYLTQIDQVYDGAVAKYGSNWTNNQYNDDITWWAMACARAYQITGEQKYLTQSKYHFDWVFNGQWDTTTFNGGIWWKNNVSDHTTKNACINFPAAMTAINLYNITKDEKYLKDAENIYRWGKTMLTDGNGQVFDRIELTGTYPGATDYNQGTFMGAAIGLYKLTNDTVYLNDAIKAAKYTKNHLTDSNGILKLEYWSGDLEGGKTILLRNMANLVSTLNDIGNKQLKSLNNTGDKKIGEELNQWIVYNTETAWSHRSTDNIVDGNWSGTLLSGTVNGWAASSVVEALNVVQPQKINLHSDPTLNPYGKVEAEDYNIASGVGIESCSEGTAQLAGIQSGNYAEYKNVDFGVKGATGFIARTASATGGGNIEIRIDGLDGPKIATCKVDGTGGWDNFYDATATFSKITGKHDMYLIFQKTNDDYLFNLNWFRFTTNDPTTHDAFTKLKSVNYSSSSNVGIDPTMGFINDIKNNGYSGYKSIDFGTGATGFTAHIQSGFKGGSIEIKLDSLTGTTVGIAQMPALGSWDNWSDINCIIDNSAVKGVHDLYLIYHGTDGNDYPCNLDWFTFTDTISKNRDAIGKIEAEDYTAGSGIGTESGAGVTYLAGIYGPNNCYVMYNNIDFGSVSPTKFYVNAASATSGGNIEIRLDSMNGTLIGTCNVAGTGGWQNFAISSCNISTPVTGKHIVYLLFKGNDWLYNMDKFTFGDKSVLTDITTPIIQPIQDHVPLKDVENVQILRGNDYLTLYWDGPYDIYAQKILITVFKNKQIVGDIVSVNRGVQTATITGLIKDAVYSIQFKSVDTSGNISKGIVISTNKYKEKLNSVK